MIPSSAPGWLALALKLNPGASGACVSGSLPTVVVSTKAGDVKSNWSKKLIYVAESAPALKMGRSGKLVLNFQPDAGAEKRIDRSVSESLSTTTVAQVVLRNF